MMRSSSAGISLFKRTGCHLIHHAEREKVCGRIELFAESLLGRHVSDGAQRRARGCQLIPIPAQSAERLALFARTPVAVTFASSEIQNLGMNRVW
jgi:hypothetical protein